MLKANQQHCMKPTNNYHLQSEFSLSRMLHFSILGGIRGCSLVCVLVSFCLAVSSVKPGRGFQVPPACLPTCAPGGPPPHHLSSCCRSTRLSHLRCRVKNIPLSSLRSPTGRPRIRSGVDQFGYVCQPSCSPAFLSPCFTFRSTVILLPHLPLLRLLVVSSFTTRTINPFEPPI